MEKLPLPWVERIFERLECAYKTKWTDLLGNEKRRNIHLVQWSTGLAGLSAQEIQRALTMCECSLRDCPPTVVEFWHIAKGLKFLKRAAYELPMTEENREIAKHYLSEIKSKIHGSVSHRT
jgi:hypothetical protein